jgi:hypothetical protein
MTNTVITVKMLLFAVFLCWCIKFKLFHLHSYHGLSATTVGELYSVPKFTASTWLQKYRRDGQVERHRGTGLWRISNPAPDAAFVADAHRNPFGDLKAATGIPGQKPLLIARLKEAGLRAQHAVVKELLNDEHKLYHLAFDESNVDHSWDSLILSDVSTFSSANEGLVLVKRPRGQHYNSQYMPVYTCSGHVSFHCWG